MVMRQETVSTQRVFLQFNMPTKACTACMHISVANCLNRNLQLESGGWWMTLYTRVASPETCRAHYGAHIPSFRDSQNGLNPLP